MKRNNAVMFRNAALALGTVVGLLGCQPKAAPTPPVTPQPAEPTDDKQPVAEAPKRDYPDPPPPGTPKPVNFPGVESFQTSNGLTVYIVENHEVPVVSTQVVIRCGSMDDDYLANFTAFMLGEGTTTRSKAKIDEAIEFAGGSLSVGAGTHVTTVRGRSLKSDLKLTLTLMADEIRNPAFPAGSLDKVKDQAKTALGFAKSQPSVLADTLFDSVAYPEGHPYGRPFPTEEDIDKITLDDLKKFHATFYRANNAFIIMSGDITKGEAEPLVKRAFGRWKSIKPEELPPNPLNKFKREDFKVPSGLTIHLVDRPTSAQTEVRVGNLAIARNHDDWVKLRVTNSILGDDASGRLFSDIREKRGLAYGIGSEVTSQQAPGTFVISTRTRTKTTGEMLGAIFEHIKRIRNDDPEAEEFDGVIQKIVGQFPLGIETAGDIASKVRTQLVYKLDDGYWRDYRDSVAGVQRSDIKKVARKYIHPIPHVVIVGKAKKIEKQLKKVLPKAKVIKYDTELKRK